MGHDLLPPAPLVLAGAPLPLVGPARIYACGVTPYDVTHLGHAATFVWVDALVRTLRHANLQPIVTRNITDVDDVLTEAARKAGSPYDEFAAIHRAPISTSAASCASRRHCSIVARRTKWTAPCTSVGREPLRHPAYPRQT
ncbi:MAG: hypothetical protein RL347_1814 [Actinomycetota bacterium]|jgi:cysteinyl-tRNA synthetase